MDRARSTVAWLLLAVLSGCAQTGAIRDHDLAEHAVVSDPPNPAEPATNPATPTTPPAGPAAASKSPAATANKSPAAAPVKSAPEPPKEIRSEALTEIVAELESLGGLDPAAQQQLMADLKQTDPALWPQLLEAFRASVAYRRRAQQQFADAQAAPKAPGYDQVVVCDTQAGPPKVQTAEISRPASRMVAPPEAAPAKVASFSATAEAPGDVAPTPGAATPSAVNPAMVAPATAAQVPGAASAVAVATPPVPAATAAAATPAATTPPANTTTVAAAPVPPSPPIDDRDWQAHLTAAIDRLERENTQTPTNAAEVSRHAALRMLYLVDGRREEALQPIDGIPPGQQDFWSKQLYGLSAYLDTERNTDSGRRAAEATMHFRDATAKLSELATLSVKSLAFCSEVSSYGVYKAFDKHEFQPGQEVLLYAEVENFKSESTDKGFRTALRSSYQILDPHGARVSQQEFALTEEYCRNPRRDFFIRYFVWMPKRIYGGKYTLQLTIEDTLSQKIGQSTIEFEIKEPQGTPQ